MGKTIKKGMAEENETYILPSHNEEMRNFISKFKVDMMEHVILSVQYALKNNMSTIEIFQFKNSPFVVTMNDSEFSANLEFIKEYFINNNMYELCPTIEKLLKILKRKNL